MNSLTSRTKPISQILKPTSKTLYIALFSTSPNPLPPPSSSYHNSTSSRRHEVESRSVRVSVWWDIENCGVPVGVNAIRIVHYITSAVRLNGIKGPLQINAFGDVFCLNKANQEALSSTGVNLLHVPNGGKNSADRSLLVDLMYWVYQNPPPAHIFLISGDRDFAGILHKLRMRNYNILLAAREANETPDVLCNASSIMWHWTELVKGENLSGKHFNQPPDGPYNSWYGCHRGALEDPFAKSPPQKLSDPDDSSSNKKPHPKVSSIVHKKPSEKSKNEILADCQKLMEELLSQNPDGFNMGVFKTQFILKYEYDLDYKKLGYRKLISLLQTIPRVKINSCLVYCDCWPKEKSDSTHKAHDADSPWGELGPIEKSNLGKEEAKSSLDGNGFYKQSMSNDDELFDMERENPESSEFKVMNEKNSSFLQILNTCYTKKDESDPKNRGFGPKIWVSSSSSEDVPRHKSKSYKFDTEDDTEIKKDKPKVQG